jgi:hypothetical protein
MIELEVYAAGLRNIDKILELDHLLETIPGLRYKVDRSHDLLYLEMEETAITLRELRAMFRKIGLEPRSRMKCAKNQRRNRWLPNRGDWKMGLGRK